MQSKFSPYKLPLLLLFLVLLLDQGVKFWVKTTMFYGEEISIFGLSWAKIYFVENNGMAFGMEFAGEYGKLILSLFRIGAIGLITYYLFDLIKNKAPKGFIISIALILAGAIGNILDSLFYGMIFSYSSEITRNVAEFMPEAGGYAPMLYGKVVDMLYFPLIEGFIPSWSPIWPNEHFIFFRPIFNIADSSISIGVAIIILKQRTYLGKHKKSNEQVPETLASEEQSLEVR